MQVKLGQLFLLRRDLKQEISNSTGDIMSLVSYREDKESTKDEYFSTMLNILDMRQKLHIYDRLIEQENSKLGTITFKDRFLSLNEARHYKVHLVATLAFNDSVLRHASQYNKRVEGAIEYIETPGQNGAILYIEKRVEKKYIVVPPLATLKEYTKELKQNVQLLDSLIQQLDWEIMVEIP